MFKVGDVVQIVQSGYNIPEQEGLNLTIAVVNTTPKGLIYYDTLEGIEIGEYDIIALSIPYLNEQKLKKALGI